MLSSKTFKDKSTLSQGKAKRKNIIKAYIVVFANRFSESRTNAMKANTCFSGKADLLISKVTAHLQKSSCLGGLMEVQESRMSSLQQL